MLSSLNYIVLFSLVLVDGSGDSACQHYPCRGNRVLLPASVREVWEIISSHTDINWQGMGSRALPASARQRIED